MTTSRPSKNLEIQKYPFSYTYNYNPNADIYLSRGYKPISKEALIENIALLIDEILITTDSQPETLKTIFHATKIPPISVKGYLTRIKDNFYCSEECFIFAMIYMDRITESRNGLLPTSFNIHRLKTLIKTFAHCDIDSCKV